MENYPSVKANESLLQQESMLKILCCMLKIQVIKTQLHLEDRTDRNIELLAENHSNLIDKLNQAIPAANKNLTYEVKVNYLLDRVSTLEKKVQILEAK